MRSTIKPSQVLAKADFLGGGSIQVDDVALMRHSNLFIGKYTRRLCDIFSPLKSNSLNGIVSKAHDDYDVVLYSKDVMALHAIDHANIISDVRSISQVLKWFTLFRRV